jgi:hypothetical protein
MTCSDHSQNKTEHCTDNQAEKTNFNRHPQAGKKKWKNFYQPTKIERHHINMPP